MSSLDIDALLARTHERIGCLGLDITTYGNGDVDIRWRRDYLSVGLSDERVITAAPSLTAALYEVIAREDLADERDATEGAE